MWQEATCCTGHSFFSSARGRVLQLTGITSSIAASWETELLLIPGLGCLLIRPGAGDLHLAVDYYYLA